MLPLIPAILAGKLLLPRSAWDVISNGSPGCHPKARFCGTCSPSGLSESPEARQGSMCSSKYRGYLLCQLPAVVHLECVARRGGDGPIRVRSIPLNLALRNELQYPSIVWYKHSL
jgi:hypothetical protein